MATRTYVEFEQQSGGKVVREVSGRDVSRLTVPSTALSFRFFDVVSESQEKTEEPDLESKRLNESPLHYYGGTVIQQGQVSHGDMLREMMEETVGRKVTHIIRTRFGGYRPFFPGENIHIPKNPYFDEHSRLGKTKKD